MAPKGMYRIQPTGLCKPCDPTIYADGPVDYIQPALTIYSKIMDFAFTKNVAALISTCIYQATPHVSAYILNHIYAINN